MVNNDEDQYLMLSGIQHFLFCRRQWALRKFLSSWQNKKAEMSSAHEFSGAFAPEK